MGLNDAYRDTPDFFGRRPERILEDYYARLDRGRRVLDVGAGQGRNAIFLARQGIEVDALEPAGAALEFLDAAVQQESLPIKTRRMGFEQFEPEETYGGVLLFGVIQMLEWASISRLIDKVARWTAPGGLVFVTGFSTDDPVHERCRREWARIGKNSFQSGSGVRTFLEPREILRLFDRYGVLHYWEGMGPEHRHGDGPLHHHAIIEAVLSRSTTGV